MPTELVRWAAAAAAQPKLVDVGPTPLDILAVRLELKQSNIPSMLAGGSSSRPAN